MRGTVQQQRGCRLHVGSGVYTGSIIVNDPRLPTTTVPFTIDIADSDVPFPLAGLVIVIFIGTLYLMILRRSDADTDNTVGFTDLNNYLARPSGFAAVISASAAAFGVFATTYLTNQSWGSTSDWLTLITAMFTAFVSTGTAFRFAANIGASRPPDDKEPADQPRQEANNNSSTTTTGGVPPA